MRTAVIFFLVLSLIQKTVSGQQLNFNSFDPEDLGTSFFYDAQQNEQGQLFIATANGLLSYNGIEFQLFTDQDGLHDNFVHKLYVDHLNQLWISYYKGGVGSYVNGEFKLIDEQIYVDDFYESSNGHLFFLGSDGSYKLTESQAQPTQTYSNFSKLESFGLNNQIGLSTDGVLSFESNDGNSIQLNSDVLDCVVDPKNTHFLGQKENSLLVYSSFNDGLPKFEIEINLDSILNADQLTTLHIFEKSIFIGTQTSGLIELDLNPGYQSYTVRRFGKNEGLKSTYINCLFTDQERNLWIGSYGESLEMIGPNRLALFPQYFEDERLKANDIEYFQGELYVASDFGLKKLKSNDFLNYPELQGKHINCIESARDTLWIGTNSGIFYLNKNQLKKFEFGSLREQPEFINCIVSKDGRLHVGSNSGYYRYDFISNSPEHLTMNEGMAHNVVENILPTSRQGIWFDSPNSPIYRLHKNEIQLFQEVDGFVDYNISAFTERKSSIWIGTPTNGLFVFENNQFRQLSTKDNLFSNSIKFLEQTKDDKVVVGHNYGVSIIQFVGSNTEITDLGFIKNLEHVSDNGSYLSASNYLWVATNQGAIRIPHINEFRPRYTPNLFIEQFLLDQEHYDYSSEIELPYGNHYFEVDFGAIYLSNAQSLSYKYILEGYDQDWNTADFNESVARYQSIYDGEYTFKVKLFFNGIETEQIIEIPFRIEKPYWKKAWFYVVIIIALLILFIGSIYYTAQRNKKIQVQLAREVKERTTDLVEKNHELEELSVQYLKAKDTAEAKSKQIEESISYAKNIQKVLLRKKEYGDWTAVFKDFFLLFKPKDQVSGDFYWGFAENNYSYVAVADCTGHGVPGAMISMLGSTFLQEIIADTKDPGKILDELRRRVIDGLDQNEDSELIDGMDISLIRLDHETNKIVVAGAMNPVYIVRPSSNTQVLEECKTYVKDEHLTIYGSPATKQPIGFYFKMTPFKETTIQLCEGDELYLLSDGYVDQYGGPNDKKFMRKQLFAIMKDIYGKSGKEQKDILWKVMQEWMEGHEQIDDISIIGIKI